MPDWTGRYTQALERMSAFTADAAKRKDETALDRALQEYLNPPIICTVAELPPDWQKTLGTWSEPRTIRYATEADFVAGNPLPESGPPVAACAHPYTSIQFATERVICRHCRSTAEIQGWLHGAPSWMEPS